MSVLFRSLAELLEKVEVTKKRLKIIDMTAKFLRNLNIDEVEPAVSMILGRAFPKWSAKKLDVSWATLSGVMQRVTQVNWDIFRKAFKETGDLGAATKVVFKKIGVKKQALLLEKALTVAEVRRMFLSIAETAGAGSRAKKERLVAALLSQTSPLEAKFIVRIFVGEMRTGLSEGLMEQAVAYAFNVPLSTLHNANMVMGDIGEVAVIAKSGGEEHLSLLDFEVFRPVRLMLAQMASNVEEALIKHKGKTAFEYKYDGARVQIHKRGDQVRIFSRRLTDVTRSLPELVEVVRENIKAAEAIMEGEVIAVDEVGNPIPFQHLMRRFKRIHKVGDMVAKIPVELYLFDILFLDGKRLVTLPYLQRRNILALNSGKIKLTTQLVIEKKARATFFLKEALDAGHEGLMAKELDSLYSPGNRGKHWLKIKPILEPLDLVITAAEYGYGRRHGWLSDYYLAARDTLTGEFVNVGKTFKGLTDAEIIEMTRRLKEQIVGQKGNRVVVIPKIVVEVAYNEIQRSNKYKCGMALRFARIRQVREEKSPEEADTIEKVRRIFERQFSKKGKYKAD